MEHNFLPYLYKVKRNKRYTSVKKIILAVVIIANGIFLYIKLIHFNELSFKADSIAGTKIQYASSKTAYTDIICLKTYEKINKIISDDLYNKIVVNNNRIDINLIANENKAYEEIIKKIESNENMKIIKICSLEGNRGSEAAFQISLEIGSPRNGRKTDGILKTRYNQNRLNYSDIIHFVNLYNGQINEFKVNNGILDVNIRLEGDKEKTDNFLKEIETNNNLNKINSISLEKKDMSKLHCELNIDIEFKV